MYIHKQYGVSQVKMVRRVNGRIHGVDNTPDSQDPCQGDAHLALLVDFCHRNVSSFLTEDKFLTKLYNIIRVFVSFAQDVN